MSVTFPLMPRAKKSATTTIRVDSALAEELEVISEYIEEISGKPTTIGSLLNEWTRPHILKHRQKAIDHRIDKYKRMRENN